MTKDHLGSVDSVTSGSGSVEVRLSFASFGQRRNESGWSGNPTSGDWTQITGTTRRGFTAHEMIDNLSLVHMNGRVYDPVVGRFLSADPLVATPCQPESHNRYAYVLNNPLSFSDPTGFKAKSTKRPRPTDEAPPPPPASAPDMGGITVGPKSNARNAPPPHPFISFAAVHGGSSTNGASKAAGSSGGIAVSPLETVTVDGTRSTQDPVALSGVSLQAGVIHAGAVPNASEGGGSANVNQTFEQCVQKCMAIATPIVAGLAGAAGGAAAGFVAAGPEGVVPGAVAGAVTGSIAALLPNSPVARVYGGAFAGGVGGFIESSMAGRASAPGVIGASIGESIGGAIGGEQGAIYGGAIGGGMGGALSNGSNLARAFFGFRGLVAGVAGGYVNVWTTRALTSVAQSTCNQVCSK